MIEQTPLQMALAPRVVRRSFIVAMVVGSVLCLINQGDALFAGRGLVWWKVGPTYMVPFLVSTFGAWSMARASQ